MDLFEELDRQDRGQAAEDIEVIPLDDVSHRRGDDHAPEVLRDLRASHIVLLRISALHPFAARGLAGPHRSEACVSLGLRGTLLGLPPNAHALRMNSPTLDPVCVEAIRQQRGRGLPCSILSILCCLNMIEPDARPFGIFGLKVSLGCSVQEPQRRQGFGCHEGSGEPQRRHETRKEQKIWPVQADLRQEVAVRNGSVNGVLRMAPRDLTAVTT